MEKAIFSHIHRFQHTSYADIEECIGILGIGTPKATASSVSR